MTALATVLPTGAESLDTELVELLGGASAVLATLGMLLLLPIYLGHRREVERLLEWKNREPEAGTTEFRAVPGPGAPAARSTGGRMTAAERVTSERPALTRISTAEYAAIEPEPQTFWQRVVDRGPRHPLVMAIIAILIAIGAFVLGSKLIRSDEETGGKGDPIDRGSVSIAILNATSGPGTGAELSKTLQNAGFTVDSTSVPPDSESKSVVYYAQGEKRAGKVVAKVLKLPDIKVFGSEQEAAAGDAIVVVVAGEDGEAAPVSGDSGSGDSGDGGGDSGSQGDAAPAG
jgi:hypothetical protein